MKAGRALNRPMAIESAGKLLDGYLRRFAKRTPDSAEEDDNPPSVAELS